MADLDDHPGYDRLFGGDDLTFGTGFPLTGAREERPDPEEEMRLAARAESLGYAGLWARDVPLYWPRFGDAGQTFDPWTWLGYAAAHTDEVALGTASVVLPLRHPLHVAKSAASLDRISGGRFVLGAATGDRDPEFPAFGVDADGRGERFRESVALLRTAWSESFPEAAGDWGRLDGDLDTVPKPAAGSIPVLPTGFARQELDWIAEHGDGWFFYHLPESTLESYLEDWRAVAGDAPYAMAVRTELAADPDAEPEPRHLGYRAGAEWFVEYFRSLDRLGVDHVLVSPGGGDDPEAGLERFADDVIDRL
ncbi:TIGR03571 family LLM class oxidoreductase (plasmid) [Halobaculum sp. CBA1158]|uniref:TIGR03571 family LLM class oxidoreductase n=1 Tax=Halobaculum sp. CBA1158 TaxID=2904243 RepID=UPI001F3E4D8C|nr:TIGR03571 family LLM class oxidoreductase [Halobaculum sp. CBA1158]UIP01361.1 TIGR03571 family LLM class oxidoreductase [Halobaculum sp. CBA1158]